MTTAHTRYKALIIAGFITAMMVTGIANLSYATQKKSVLDFAQPNIPCSLIFCTLV